MANSASTHTAGPIDITIDIPAPLLSSKRLRMTVPSHPRGNTAQVTVPLPPPPRVYWTKDARCTHEGM